MLYPAVRLVVKSLDEVDHIGRQTSFVKYLLHIILGDGGERRGEVQEDAGPMIVHEGGMHGCRINVEKILQD